MRFAVDRLKQAASSSTTGNYSIVINHLLPNDVVNWNSFLALLVHLVAYVAILVVMMFIVFVIMKCLANFEDQRTLLEITGNDTDPLLPTKAGTITYGTCGNDLESGKCSSCSSSSSSSRSGSFSSELYDAKLCIICFDEERNCFFVPCGHSATCYFCAQRIFYGENKVCPVCRRLIRRVRKLFA
ncbi:hypothetical protein K2173_014821 [Erythroxylum novogranatense]|uniref:RING-type domain-containing protein n=1 Tax=Erythroxylum novogranatense TaxID=1862640 RepID=A0AAV8THM6_9ROSI|nr:hypothetical protein K2173_014821 [Erythroxylum novogranatense]